jgi:hypothetical protein
MSETLNRRSRIDAPLCRAPLGRGTSSALDTQIAEKQECGFIWSQEAGSPQHRQTKDYEIFELMAPCTAASIIYLSAQFALFDLGFDDGQPVRWPTRSCSLFIR